MAKGSPRGEVGTIGMRGDRPRADGRMHAVRQTEHEIRGLAAGDDFIRATVVGSLSHGELVHRSVTVRGRPGGHGSSSVGSPGRVDSELRRL